MWSIALYGSESRAVKNTSRCLKMCGPEDVCYGTEYKINVWVRQKIGVPEENGLVAQLKKRKLAKYGHWKRRSEGLVTAVTEIEIEGKCLRRTAWIDDVRRWTVGGLPDVR